jgi:hypothetical protein
MQKFKTLAIATSLLAGGVFAGSLTAVADTYNGERVCYAQAGGCTGLSEYTHRTDYYSETRAPAKHVHHAKPSHAKKAQNDAK